MRIELYETATAQVGLAMVWKQNIWLCWYSNLVGKSGYPNDYQHDPNKRSVETWANAIYSNKGSSTIVVEAYAHQVWNVGDKLMVGGGSRQLEKTNGASRGLHY